MNIAGPFSVKIGAYPATDAELIAQVQGLVVGIGIHYDTASTVDLDITEENENAPVMDILAISSSNTDGWYAPVAPIHSQSGGAIANQYGLGLPVYGSVHINISSAQPDDIVYVTFKLG
jgi:hypothetical protein